MERCDLILTANSPGEVAGWVTPMVPALREAVPGARVTVFVPPCTFASGCELQVVAGIPGVDQSFGPGEFLRYAVLGLRPPGFEPGPRGAVLFLGGELTNAVLLRKRLGYPAFAYTEGFVNWTDAFTRFAVPYGGIRDKLLAKGVPEEKVVVVGNLMLDAVRPQRRPGTVREELGVAGRDLVLLLPGSRPAEVGFMTPFLVKTADLLRQRKPETAFVLSLSPFAEPRQLEEALRGPLAEEFGAAARFVPDAGDDPTKAGFLETDGGNRIPVRRGIRFDLMAAADLALTIPGTNTAELGYLGVPMVITLPLNHPELIPLEGLAGLVGNLPSLGKALKRKILPRLAARMPYAAWPNRLAERYLVPELRGEVYPEAVAEESAALLSDHRRRAAMTEALRRIMGEQGAARRLAAMVAKEIARRYGQPQLASQEETQ
jgi:lipid-A-disaccharide synthase